MTEELKIWALGEGNEIESIKGVSGMDLEHTLEETLVKLPEMLETGIHLVGRQTPTDGGGLDLLGVDRDGRLVVYELKRGKVTRDAVTQCIDYASDLNAKDPEELADYIAEHSGTGGIEPIDDFAEWYEERIGESELDALLLHGWCLLALASISAQSGWQRSCPKAASTSRC